MIVDKLTLVALLARDSHGVFGCVSCVSNRGKNKIKKYVCSRLAWLKKTEGCAGCLSVLCVPCSSNEFRSFTASKTQNFLVAL